ncbi:unnamed protein product [Orchesella dallaii]|uniref:Speckle-type POZ protein n=1 Tax=Orchesella dallaii TaxID=48710 RepID=A0ABP1QTQ7_9HEXA
MSDLQEIESPVFPEDTKTKHNWQLSMFPKKKVENKDYIALYLSIVGGVTDDVKASFQFSILNTDGRAVIQTSKRSHIFSRPNYPYFGVRKVTSSAGLIAPEQQQQLVANDSLKILCQVWIDDGLKQKLGAPNISAEETSRLWKDDLANYIEKMYKESIGTDVTVLAGTSNFKAHKAILTGRSSVFAAMLNNNENMLEMATATVTITDFDQEVVKGMLDYLYTGQADCMEERALELLQIAEKYELTGLKGHCEYVISENLKFENVVMILVLAHNQNASYLKSRAFDFINMNKQELSQMESFQADVKTYSASEILAELYLAQP